MRVFLWRKMNKKIHRYFSCQINYFKRSHCRCSGKFFLKNSFSEVCHVKFAVKIPEKSLCRMYFFGKFPCYKLRNLYPFICIVQGFASFKRRIFQNLSESLLLLFLNQIPKSDIFRQTVCVLILVNISNIINPSLSIVVCYKQAIQLIYSLVSIF